MGLLRIMDPMHGDQQTVFNPADPVSLDAAVKHQGFVGRYDGVVIVDEVAAWP